MTRTRIKICGLRTPQDAHAAVQAGADAVGLVFVDASPRCVDLRQARAIVQSLPAFVEPVGLFVDAPCQQVMAVASDLGLRTVQLHGREAVNEVASLAPLRVIKALPAGSGALGPVLNQWQAAGDNLSALLWDAPAPAGALAGGTGRCADWGQLAQMSHAHALPTILAGGLTPQNVAQAIAQVRPYAVDVSSGVESQRGVKDAEKIAAFCAAVRAADQASQIP